MMNESSLETLTVYCTEKDFVQRFLRSSNMKARRWQAPYCRHRNKAMNCFVVGLPFLLGLALGIPVAYYSLNLRGIESRTTSRSTNPLEEKRDTTYSSYVMSSNSSSLLPSVLPTAKDIGAISSVIAETEDSGHQRVHSSTKLSANVYSMNLNSKSETRVGYPSIDNSIDGGETQVRATNQSEPSNMRSSDVDMPLFVASGKSDINLLNKNNRKFYRVVKRRRFPPRSRLLNSENSVTPDMSKVNGSLRGLGDLLDGIFWSEKAEDLVPKGFIDEDINEWRLFLNKTRVLKIEEGCGRMQNRLVIFDGGERSCCRYRHNNDQIQGEIFSFYLGRTLGLANLLPSALALVRPRDSKWFPAASQVAIAQWSPDHPVVLTKFIKGLEPEYIPVQLRPKKDRRLHPQDVRDGGDVAQLVQWSDLIIFDYLTANLDRIVNNMYNERWNADMMKQPTHNLARTSDGLLLFLDNESGLLHGYRLLEKYEHFHRSLLDSLCVFRRRTVDVVRRLRSDSNVDTLLREAFVKGDPGMSDWLPFLPEKSIKVLKERIATVDDQVRKCELMYGQKNTVHR